MAVKNFYPKLPIVVFKKTAIPMATIIEEIKKANCDIEIKRVAYVIIRNETSNGQSVINATNVSGVQSDSGVWSGNWASTFVATCIKRENLTGKERGFIVFDSLKSGVEFVCDKILQKGLFIGEKVEMRYHKGDVITPEQLADAYQDEWVYGENHNTTKVEANEFISMYNQAKNIFT